MKKLKSVLFTIFGTMMTGFSIGAFLIPNKVVGGGASGISNILYHTFGIQSGLSLFLINIVFLMLGLTVLDKKFILNTLLGAALRLF
ncbi:MAG: YitT family protein [Acutalibacteraceae bacterium]|nr:YitT family protein [Acutalibacteraceae bacterium]